MKNNCYIHGIGLYTPTRILTNDELSHMVDTTDEWISTRTGIKQRHILSDGEQLSDMGFLAATEALDKAGLAAQDISHIIVATTTPEYTCPATAGIIANRLGCTNAMAFDFNAACTGFLYGLAMVQGFLASTPKSNILLICAEALTRKLNWQDRSSCVLFGDGAGAMVFKSTPQKAVASLVNVSCHSDGKLHDLITIGGGTHKSYALDETIGEEMFLHMQGREVFKHAVRNMTAVCNEVLEANNTNIEQIDLFIPHQANLRIIEAVGNRLNIDESKVFTNVQKYGNTSSASVPIAIAEAVNSGRIKSKDMVLVSAVGAGFTWGAGLFEFM